MYKYILNVLGKYKHTKQSEIRFRQQDYVLSMKRETKLEQCDKNDMHM